MFGIVCNLYRLRGLVFGM